MRLVGAVPLTCATLLLVAGSTPEATGGAKGATNAEKILGKWEATKGEIPAGALLQFTEDGKVRLTLDLKGAEVPIAWSTLQGAYKVEGDRLKTVGKMGDKEVRDTFAIKALNETTLVIENKRGKTEEFKRKK
jgi:uncharacterized protein (TIGR03066 family)